MQRLSLHNANYSIDMFTYWHSKHQLDLDPPYQRGDVWGYNRRVNFIYSLCLGLPVGAIVLNDRLNYFADRSEEAKPECYGVIDGKQRITTLLKFLNSDLVVPGRFFDVLLSEVVFEDIPLAQRRRFGNLSLNCVVASLTTIEEEKEVFDLINFGGLQQGQVDSDE